MPIFRYFPFFFRYFWPDPFSYFIFLFLNFLSLFVFIFCETAHTGRFSVIFAKVQWHPCIIDIIINIVILLLLNGDGIILIIVMINIFATVFCICVLPGQKAVMKGQNSSVGSVLGLPSCVMQLCGFHPALRRWKRGFFLWNTASLA